MNMVFLLAEETNQATSGYFDIKKPDGSYDPSGLVKGWPFGTRRSYLRKTAIRIST